MEILDLTRYDATNGETFVEAYIEHRDTRIKLGLLGYKERQSLITHLKEQIEFLED